MEVLYQVFVIEGDETRQQREIKGDSKGSGAAGLERK